MEDVNRLSPFLYHKGTNNICNTKQNVLLFLRKCSVFTFINIDIISRNFKAGDIVTVNTLKDKKLIDKNICFVKVLARGVIDKPLVVKAQDFSLDAVKMIQLTGGKVVLLDKKKY